MVTERHEGALEVEHLFKIDGDIVACSRLDKDARAAGRPTDELVECTGAFAICQRFDEAYAEHALTFVVDDLRAATIRAFEQWGGIRMLAGSSWWWLPPVADEFVAAWSRWVERVDGTVLVCPQVDIDSTLRAIREAVRVTNF